MELINKVRDNIFPRYLCFNKSRQKLFIYFGWIRLLFSIELLLYLLNYTMLLMNYRYCQAQPSPSSKKNILRQITTAEKPPCAQLIQTILCYFHHLNSTKPIQVPEGTPDQPLPSNSTNPKTKLDLNLYELKQYFYSFVPHWL